uniref:Uncharacterized protein n=1 Tax=Oryza punctata TaxID=4537 RepID=A0A0E0LVA5_ORYPU
MHLRTRTYEGLDLVSTDQSTAFDDFDCYDTLRLVAFGTTDPKTKDLDDAYFLPKKLAILERDDNRSEDASIATFFKLDTGSFVRKCVPALCGYFFTAIMASGLIVLLEMMPPDKTSMFNSFHAKVSIHAEEIREVAVTTSPLMVFTS